MPEPEPADDPADGPVDVDRPLETDGGREGTDEEDPLDDLTRRIREKREKRENEGQTEYEGIGGAFGPTDDEADVEASLGDAATDIDDSADGQELFEEMDVSDVDTDAVWESVLTDETDPELGALTDSDVDVDPAVDAESVVGDDHIVPKDDYCESCHFFSTPPEVACSYEDAEILEILESGQFRVRNCPVVAGFVNVDGTASGQDRGEDATEETPSD